MALNITRGKRFGATRTIIYGPEGIGKTTLAASWPNPLFIDAEDGSNQLDVARVTVGDWKALENATKELVTDHQGFSTIVYDSIDWVERLRVEAMLKADAQKSIEGYGFGKGYTLIKEHMERFLSELDKLVAKGVHIVFVAHSKVSRMSPPDQTDGYDKYELKLSKHTAPVVKEWADMILFCNFQVQIVEGNDGKLKAQGGKDRLMYTEHSAAWDAKNRFSLPEFLPMDFTGIAHVITGTAEPRAAATKPTPTQQAAKVEQKAEQAQKAETPAVEAEAIDYCTAEQISKLELYTQNPVGAPMVQNALELVGVEAIKDLSQDEALELIASIQKAMNEVASKKGSTKASPQAAANGKLPAHFVAWFEQHATVLEAAFVKWNWIKPGQSWRDLAHDQMDKIVENPAKCAKVCSIPVPQVGGAA